MTAYFTAAGQWGSETGATVYGNVTVTANYSTTIVAQPLPPTEDIWMPIPASIVDGQLVAENGDALQLLANTPDLGLPEPLEYVFHFANMHVGGVGGIGGIPVALPDITLIAPTFGAVTVDILTGRYTYTTEASTTVLAIIGLASVSGFPTGGDRKRRLRRSIVLGLATT